MLKVKNLKLFALAMSGLSMVGCSSCSNDESMNNSINNDDISIISSVDNTETTISSFVTSNSNVIYTTSLKADDTSYVTTVGSSIKNYESLETSKSTVVDTSKKNDFTRKTESDIIKTTVSEGKGTTGVSVTVSTTMSTAMPTTTTTTTEEPIVTSEERQDYTLDDIAQSRYLLEHFGINLRHDLMSYQGSNFTDISMSYGVTGGGTECIFILAALNYDVPGVVEQLCDSFSYYDEQELLNSRDFIYRFNYVQQKFGNDVDYSKYTLNPIIGEELNQMDDAYRNGSFDEYMIDKIVNGNIDPACLANPGFMCILSSYDEWSDYIFRFNVDEMCMDEFMSCIIENVYGHSYTK